jgi:hypothetical protein
MRASPRLLTSQETSRTPGSWDVDRETSASRHVTMYMVGTTTFLSLDAPYAAEAPPPCLSLVSCSPSAA